MGLATKDAPAPAKKDDDDDDDDVDERRARLAAAAVDRSCIVAMQLLVFVAARSALIQVVVAG